MIWGLAWSLLEIYVFIPHFNASHQYPYWEKGAHLTGIAGNLAAGATVKLPTLALIFLPTAFAALRSPIAVVAVPGLLLRFVSPDTSYWGTGWHYNATVMPVVFAAAIDGLARIRAARDARGATALAGRALAGRVFAGRAFVGRVFAGRAFVGRVFAGWGIAGQVGAGGDGGPAGDGGLGDDDDLPRDGGLPRHAAPTASACGAGNLVRSFSAALDRHAPAVMAIVALALALQFPLKGSRSNYVVLSEICPGGLW